MPLAPSFDTFGWFASNADLYAKVGRVLLDKTSPPPEPSREAVDFSRFVRLPYLDALLLGTSEADEYRRMASLVSDVLGPALDASLALDIDALYWTFRRLQAYEAWAVHGPWISMKERGLGPGVKERFEYGASLDCGVAAAETPSRLAFARALKAMLGQDGVLVMPTVPGAAPLKSASFDDLQAYRERALRLLCLSGLSGLPQITVPLGKVHGAPFGISLLGPAGSDLALIGLAERLLAASG
jgi:amidase